MLKIIKKVIGGVTYPLLFNNKNKKVAGMTNKSLINRIDYSFTCPNCSEKLILQNEIVGEWNDGNFSLDIECKKCGYSFNKKLVSMFFGGDKIYVGDTPNEAAKVTQKYHKFDAAGGGLEAYIGDNYTTTTVEYNALADIMTETNIPPTEVIATEDGEVELKEVEQTPEPAKGFTF